jgi:glucosamine 6-phosphate synthetase-like amidotransferase/phosphosugar isomerase protein
VLTNFNTLKAKVKDASTYNNVDSSIIPALLNQFSEESDNEVEIITEALSLLEGTFSVWIFCTLTGAMYIARSGSTLYADFITNDFSSLPYKKYKSVDEGVLYLLTREGLTSVGIFTPNSPFFTL